MKKMIGAAVLGVIALSGCGGPLEEDSAAPPVGSTQQAVLDKVGVPLEQQSQLNLSQLQNPQLNVVRVPQFQEQQHVTDPLHRNNR